MMTIEPLKGSSSIAGWYGKLPCLGDFASRRLTPEFVTPWDAWLQRSIAASRRDLGERWLDLYLTSPMWRFVLARGVCGENPCIGLLLPSVDKVGRYFPLTLALSLDTPEVDIVMLLAMQGWFAGLEQIGLAALNVDFSAEQLEAALAEHPFPAPLQPAPPQGARDIYECLRDLQPEARSFHVGNIENLAAAASAGARAFVASAAAGKSYWWSVDQESGAAEFHYAARLPSDDYFTVLLGGSRSTAVAREALPLDPLQALDAAASQ